MDGQDEYVQRVSLIDGTASVLADLRAEWDVDHDSSAIHPKLVCFYLYSIHSAFTAWAAHTGMYFVMVKSFSVRLEERYQVRLNITSGKIGYFAIIDGRKSWLSPAINAPFKIKVSGEEELQPCVLGYVKLTDRATCITQSSDKDEEFINSELPPLGWVVTKEGSGACGSLFTITIPNSRYPNQRYLHTYVHLHS